MRNDQGEGDGETRRHGDKGTRGEGDVALETYSYIINRFPHEWVAVQIARERVLELNERPSSYPVK